MAALILLCWRFRRSRPRPSREPSELDWAIAAVETLDYTAKPAGDKDATAAAFSIHDDALSIAPPRHRASTASSASSETLCNPPSHVSAFNVSSFDVRSIGIAITPATPRAVAFANPPTESTESYRPWLDSQREGGEMTRSSAWSIDSPAKERARGFGGTFGSADSARSLPPARFSASTVSLDDNATIGPAARFSDTTIAESSFVAPDQSQRSPITSFFGAGALSTGEASAMRSSSGGELEQLHTAALTIPSRAPNRSVAITDPGLVANGFAF